MRVLVIGSGGREHALALALARSTRVDEVLCAPGNAGTESIGENIPVSAGDLDALLRVAKERAVDLTVVGPEAPLCAGIVDRFDSEGLRIFGPTAAAARIEGDKAYAKRLMKSAYVPTAEGRIFDRYREARSYVASRDTGVVIKAAGLAAGKGVSVCEDPADGLLALERMMVDHAFGDAGKVVVVEELLKGQELSVFALVDDRTIYVLECAQDHKALGEGDTGPNTGGMGAYSPPPSATRDVLAKVESDILVPVVDALRRDGAPYRGVLYAGLILTAAGPKVLEFNCRFGDPEAQVLLVRLESDLFDLLEAVVDGRLAEADVRWSQKAAVCVVMTSKGYPEKYDTGKPITGLDAAQAMEDVSIFHSGTRRVGSHTGIGAIEPSRAHEPSRAPEPSRACEEAVSPDHSRPEIARALLQGHVVTAGGRVLSVTALGDDLSDAKRRAYQAVDAIHFEDAYYRRDIAARAITTAAPRQP